MLTDEPIDEDFNPVKSELVLPSFTIPFKNSLNLNGSDP